MDVSRWMPVLLAIAIVAGGMHFFYKPAYEKFYKRGVEYYDSGQYERASTEFLKAISEIEDAGDEKADAMAIDAYLMAGEILDLRLGRSKRAIELYEEMRERYPSHSQSVDAALRQAHIYLDRLNTPRKAVTVYKNLIERWPDDPRVEPLPKEILSIYMLLHEFEQVIAEAEGFLKDDPKRLNAPALRFAIGDALSTLERWAEALDVYAQVEVDYPQSYYARLARFESANCLLKLGRLKQALAAFEESLATYPNPEVVRLRIREVKRRLESTSDPDTLPVWAQRKSEGGDSGPPIITPFPEDHHPQPPPILPDEDAPEDTNAHH